MQRKTTILAPVLLLLLVAGVLFGAKKSNSLPSNEGINFFEGNLKEALAQAEKEKKLVFLDIYAIWCGPCKRLQATTFKDPDVGAYFNQNFVNIAIDGEKGEGPALAEKLQLTAYPTLFILDAHGKVKHKIVGYRSAYQLLEEVQALK